METSIWREHGCASVFFCFILKLYPHVSCLTLYFLPLSGSLPFLLLTCLLSAYCTFICSVLSCVSLSHLPLMCFPPFGSCFLGFIYCLYFVLLYFSVISCLVIALLLLSFGLQFFYLYSIRPLLACVFSRLGLTLWNLTSILSIMPGVYMSVCLSICLWTDLGRALAS